MIESKFKPRNERLLWADHDHISRLDSIVLETASFITPRNAHVPASEQCSMKSAWSNGEAIIEVDCENSARKRRLLSQLADGQVFGAELAKGVSSRVYVVFLRN